MSAMGVVTVIEGNETEFCLLGEWIEEESWYHMVRQMRFFKYFLHNKFLRLWRAQVRAATFRKAREKLKTSLLRCRATFIKPLQEVRARLFPLRTGSSFYRCRLLLSPCCA
jgi:dynein heavy chain